MLSQRARAYLSTLVRNDEWVTNPAMVIEYFTKQGVFLSDNLLKVQLDYSGYKLTIKGDPGHAFLLNFISKRDVSKNTEIVSYPLKRGYLLEFGEHATAQFTFYITDEGEICTWGPEVGDEPNIICSSVEKFIEQYALQNELTAQVEYPGYYKISNLEQLESMLHQDFDEITVCSDMHSYWGTNETLTVVKGTWLHEPKFYLHVYGKNRDTCVRFIDKLKFLSIIN
jgi:hypothetical protein